MSLHYCPECDKTVEMAVVILTDKNGYYYQAYEHKCSPDRIVHLDKQLEDLNTPETMQASGRFGRAIAEAVSEYYHKVRDNLCSRLLQNP